MSFQFLLGTLQVWYNKNILTSRGDFLWLVLFAAVKHPGKTVFAIPPSAAKNCGDPGMKRLLLFLRDLWHRQIMPEGKKSQSKQ